MWLAEAIVEGKRERAKASAIPPPPQVRAVRPTAARARPERSQAEQHTRKAGPRRSVATGRCAAWASQSAISTRSACFPTSRSCTLRVCKSPHCSVQVSARRRCNPRQVAPVAKGRRLTLPSSGQSKGCALRPPLMSNVRRLKHHLYKSHGFNNHPVRFATNETVKNHSRIDMASIHCRRDSASLAEPLHAFSNSGNHSAVASITVPSISTIWSNVSPSIFAPSLFK